MRLEEAAVLLVDDEQDLLEIFGVWLGRHGCRVLTASNGAQALEILTREKIDVLVSDIRMPVMNGIELVRSVFGRGLFIPSIIFVSGFGDVKPREMYGLGVELLMDKPLTRSELIQALEESLMDRSQMWQIPSGKAVEQGVALSLASFARAVADCTFQLGRGGCCFSTDARLEEGATIGLAIDFVEDGLCLRAEGTVRWQEQHDGRTGVSFDYLAPECRNWLLDSISKGSYRSFIPQCRCEGGRSKEIK